MSALTRGAVVAIGAPIVMAGSLLIGGIVGTHGTANASPQEDGPGWSCVDDGNRVCGPGNANGAPAGCYDDGGVMVAPWPCYVVIGPDGSGEVYR